MLSSRANGRLRTPGALATRVISALVLGFAGACSSAPVTAPRPSTLSYDVVIENGRIVDGTGNPWMYGDVGIKGDRIVAVTLPGALRDRPAAQRIDARGHIVAPGFIDVQGHSWEPL